MANKHFVNGAFLCAAWQGPEVSGNSFHGIRLLHHQALCRIMNCSTKMSKVKRSSLPVEIHSQEGLTKVLETNQHCHVFPTSYFSVMHYCFGSWITWEDKIISWAVIVISVYSICIWHVWVQVYLYPPPCWLVQWPLEDLQGYHRFYSCL